MGHDVLSDARQRAQYDAELSSPWRRHNRHRARGYPQHQHFQNRGFPRNYHQSHRVVSIPPQLVVLGLTVMVGFATIACFGLGGRRLFEGSGDSDGDAGNESGMSSDGSGDQKSMGSSPKLPRHAVLAPSVAPFLPPVQFTGRKKSQRQVWML